MKDLLALWMLEEGHGLDG